MAQNGAISIQEQASSGMPWGERNRTNASICGACGDAPSRNGVARNQAVRLMAGLLALGSLTMPAWAQVRLTLDNTTPGYPSILACNSSDLPQQVQGWKFKTKNYAGYTTWMQPFSHTGTAPVEYTQKIPDTEQLMQAEKCRSAATDYTAVNVPAGQDATIIELQSLVKTGSCNELPPYTDAAALSCPALDGAGKPKYDNACLVGGIGANGGDTYGGFVSTFAGQTQIQAAIPPATFSISGTDVKWNPYRMGPQYMMAVSMAQEILNVDMQWLIAIAGKETGAGMINVGNNTVRSEDGSYTDNGTYGYWQIEDATYATYIMAYPQFFPKYGPCASKYPDATTANVAGRCVEQTWGEAAVFYMQPEGANKMMPNSPQIANGAFSSSMAWYNLYDALANSPDLCFLDAIKDGQDKRIAFAAMIGGYNQGRYTGFADPLLDPNLKNDPNASAKFTLGNNNYRTEVFRILDQLSGAAKNCGAGRVVYDTAISELEVKRFLFGGSGAVAGTPAAQLDGGLMLHYPLTTAEKTAMWADVQCAFGKLQGQAPSTQGKGAVISFRYDWLTLLRVVKNHLPFKIIDRKLPIEHDWQQVIKRYSTKPQTCSGKKKDETYPSMTVTSPTATVPLSPIEAPGTQFTFKATDEGKIAKAEWTLDTTWLFWDSTRMASAGNYEFHVSCKAKGWPAKGAKGAVWIRVTDDCGNSTIQQFDFTTNKLANCGDPPVPLPVATPRATPSGHEFSALTPGGVSVSLNVATLGASILITLDGSEPETVVHDKTSQWDGKPIVITETTTLKARGVKEGMAASDVMTEVYKKVPPATVEKPFATPPGRNFTGTLSVALATKTAGAAIYYTTDNTIPSDAAGTTARRFTTALSFTGNTVLKAIAVKEGMYPSEIMTETYTNIPPIPVTRAWYLDANGDGSIDQAVVVFASALPAVPDKLGFKIDAEDGKSYAKTPAGAEIKLAAGDATRAIVTFAEPFPFGVTSLKNAATSGSTFNQDAIPLADGPFAVADSVAPVIVAGEVKEPGDGGTLKRVQITYSEAVTVAAGTQPIVYKRGSVETPGSQVMVVNSEKTGDRNYAFHIDSNSVFFPIVGDWAAIPLDGSTVDAFGRAPSAKSFQLLKGTPPKAKPVSLVVTFPNGSRRDPSSGSVAANPQGVTFIPVDRDGNVLAGRCNGCVAKDARGYVGPVFMIQTPGPVKYEFKIFNTAGEFVATGKGEVTAGDLGALKRSTNAQGQGYEAPVIWTGATRSGGHAGTGAYILKATFFTEKDMTSGAAPAQFTEKKVFGLLRTWSGS